MTSSGGTKVETLWERLKRWGGRIPEPHHEREFYKTECRLGHRDCLGPDVAVNQGGCRMDTWGDL